MYYRFYPFFDLNDLDENPSNQFNESKLNFGVKNSNFETFEVLSKMSWNVFYGHILLNRTKNRKCGVILFFRNMTKFQFWPILMKFSTQKSNWTKLDLSRNRKIQKIDEINSAEVARRWTIQNKVHDHQIGLSAEIFLIAVVDRWRTNLRSWINFWSTNHFLLHRPFYGT